MLNTYRQQSLGLNFENVAVAIQGAELGACGRIAVDLGPITGRVDTGIHADARRGVALRGKAGARGHRQAECNCCFLHHDVCSDTT